MRQNCSSQYCFIKISNTGGSPKSTHPEKYTVEVVVESQNIRPKKPKQSQITDFFRTDK